MKLSAAFDLLFDLLAAGRVALLPTLRDLISSPTLLFRPHALSRIFMAHVWAGGFATETDENGKGVKTHLISPNASGVVLDLGAGHGHTISYLDRSKVTKYVALEPNVLMHSAIREAAEKASFFESDGSLVILSCGAEDSAEILSRLADSTSTTATTSALPVNTIVCVLTLCTVPEPEKTLRNLVRDVLSPGGQFLFYEHVLSHREDVAWWQRFWAPVWQQAFDGCRLDRPSHLFVQNLKAAGPDRVGGIEGGARAEESAWSEGELWGKPDEDEENLFWHQVGRFVKR